jgi:hypothetical protein
MPSDGRSTANLASACRNGRIVCHIFCMRFAPVAQRKSARLLIGWSQVRILPGARLVLLTLNISCVRDLVARTGQLIGTANSTRLLVVRLTGALFRFGAATGVTNTRCKRRHGIRNGSQQSGQCELTRRRFGIGAKRCCFDQ